MTPAPRRRWVLLAGAVAVAVLFGVRWAALETAERAWAAGVAAGDVYIQARDLARLVQGVVLLAATTWSTVQLYLVYRSIGSVQVPRRLGNLEILEAVPRWLLLAAALGGGVVYGWLLTLGTGDWWLAAALAAQPPEFGVADPVLQRDLGYYAGALPWSMRLQQRALLAALSSVLVAGALYLAIGALRFERGRPVAGAHARTHLGTLLSTLALVLAWGAVLDPAEVVAGAHGPLDHAAVAIRVPGAPAVALVAAAVAVVSLAWAWRGRPRAMPGAWGVLLATQVTVYVLAPGLARIARGEAGSALSPALAAERGRLERMALGLDALAEGVLPPYASAATAVEALPLWSPHGVSAVARQAGLFGGRGITATATLHRGSGAARTWLLAPAPDAAAWAGLSPPPTWAEIHRGRWSRTGGPHFAVETDSGLAFAPAPVRDSATWFGAGFSEFAVASADTWPALAPAGIGLVGGWRRTALAVALQSFELLNGDAGSVLLWRRDAGERLGRLLPPALFEPAIPVVSDSTLWWVATGYVTSDLFPLVRPQDPRVFPRYHHVGFIGAVNAANGDTRLYLAPGHDPLAAAWASVFAPLVRPATELPAALAGVLPFPRRAFDAAAAYLTATHGDTVPWRRRPEEPFLVPAPGGAAWWLAQGFETTRPPAFVALLAGTLTSQGPQLVLWRPASGAPAPRPPDLAGSAELKPGLLRVWPAGDALFFLQAQFRQAATAGAPAPPPALSRVYAWWGERAGEGVTARAALLDLLSPRAEEADADTTLAGRWRDARRIAAQADSALARGDLQTFARLYEELRRVLAPPRRFR